MVRDQPGEGDSSGGAFATLVVEPIHPFGYTLSRKSVSGVFVFDWASEKPLSFAAADMELPS
jgi:hypothetical protein